MTIFRLPHFNLIIINIRCNYCLTALLRGTPGYLLRHTSVLTLREASNEVVLVDDLGVDDDMLMKKIQKLSRKKKVR